jgi:hypothetical protein
MQQANFQPIHESTMFVAGIPMYLYPEHCQFGTPTNTTMTYGGRGQKQGRSKDKRR